MLFVGSIQNVRSSSRCAISACSKTMLTILIAQGFDEITQIPSKANFEKNRVLVIFKCFAKEKATLFAWF